MELDKLWEWGQRKLACRLRTENGNPAAESLRETFVELAGVDLNELLNEMKQQKKRKEMTNKVSTTNIESEKTYKDILGRSRIVGAARLALEQMEEENHAKSMTITQKNKNKLYTVLPKSPPRRVMIDIVRESSKPLRLPDQDEHKASTDKLEKKLAKQRAARMAAIEQSAKEDHASKQGNHGFDGSNGGLNASNVFNKYEGDLFSTGGQYLEGMLYLSRMADSSLRTKRLNPSLHETERKKNEDNTMNVEVEKNAKERDSNNNADEDTSSHEIATNPDINAKLSCAISLCNWSRNPANAVRLATEGAVRAIMTLSMEPVTKITVYCAAAFRFMSEQAVLAVSMIDEGAVTTISELLGSKTDDFIVNNLAMALVNLTRVNGKEGQLVEGAIILALSNLIQQKPELAPTCVRGLYNLTCVDTYYPSIDKITSKIVNLVTSGTANVKHLYAATLCNLSDLKSLRARMVEEGAITALSTLARGAETRTRRICAVILQNLSASKSVRVEMASRNSVSVAYGLSSDQDPIILRCIGLTLSRLAMESSNCQRIIHEGGIVALCNIAMKYPSIPGITQPVASAFQLLSANANYRINIVNEGCVTAIASLLRSSADMFTLQHSLLALCNLLCEADNHLPIIQQGLILTLIAMSSNENNIIKDFCSLAFLNLSNAEDSRKHLINAGAIIAIIALAKEPSDLTKRRCAATFCHLSYYTLGMIRMVNDGIIPAIVALVLAKDMVTVHCSCAALCRLCSTVENAKLILDSGAVPNLVQGTIDGDPITKQFCGSVLSTLSFYEYCRIPLVELGAIAALKGLADLNDDSTKQRCLLAFANLSCEVSVQKKMINEGVVSIIAELANSYREVNYMCCAKAICNLACCENNKLAVAKEGGVHALLMISMVQSVDRLTKVVCVLGLNNLLDETTMEFMIGEGLVISMTNLSKIGDSLGDAHISNLCAKVLNQLSRYKLARQKMIEKISTLHGIFKLCHSNVAETQIVATRTCCNLLLDEHVRAIVLKNDVLIYLEHSLQIQHKETIMHILTTIFSLCSEGSYMEIISKSHLPYTLATMSNESRLEEEEYNIIAKILVTLAYEKKSRQFLQKIGFIQILCKTLEKNYHPKTGGLWILSSLSFLFLDYPNLMDIVELGIIDILRSINHIVGMGKLTTTTTTTTTTDHVEEGSGSNGNKASINNAILYETYCAMVQILVTLSEDRSNLSTLTGCTQFLYTALQVIDQQGEAVAVAVGQEEMKTSFPKEFIIYHIALIIYRLASTTDLSIKQASAIPETRQVLEILSKYKKCADLVVVSYGMYLMDQKCRVHFTISSTATALVHLYQSSSLSESSISNLVLAFFAMSKVASCREFMMAAPLHIDRILTHLASTTENARIKANSNRAYKTLNTDVNEAIEEGAVANLIAMSIEGKLKNQASDEFILPIALPLPESKLQPPGCVQDILVTVVQRNGACWYSKVVVAKGGAAGKGPDPPDPPTLANEEQSRYGNMSEELDFGEADAKPRMSFAKMQIPTNLKDSYLLTDIDFMINNDREDNNTVAETDSTTSEMRGESQLDSQTLQQGNNDGDLVNGGNTSPTEKDGNPSSLTATAHGANGTSSPATQLAERKDSSSVASRGGLSRTRSQLSRSSTNRSIDIKDVEGHSVDEKRSLDSPSRKGRAGYSPASSKSSRDLSRGKKSSK